MSLIAIVIDERNIVSSLRMSLEAEGHAVDGYLDPLVALPKLICVPPHVLLLNGTMPGMHGIEFFHCFRKYAKTPVIFLSANADDIADELARNGTPAEGCIPMPFSQRFVISEVKRVLAERSC